MIPVPGFEGRRVAVFGVGRSGITAARALKAGGALPVLWDDGVSGRMQAEAEGFVVQDLTTADWSGFAALVLSPGAPLTHPRPHWSVDKAREAGVEIIGDLELFARALAALPGDQRPRVVAITGTNGKSTTTALIGWVLKQAGLTVHVGGNIGIGVLALPAPTPDAVYVIECSSYQLDLTTTFAPDVAMLTNITPDHLDRHGGMDGYVAAKRRIFAHAGLAVVGVDGGFDTAIARDLATLQHRNVIAVSTSVHGPTTVEFVKSYLWASGPTVVDVTEMVPGPTWPPPADNLLFNTTNALALPGRHNSQNAAFTYAAARALGVSHEDAVEGLLTFPGLAHRMEPLAQRDGVRFINDSKATNADATRQALSSYDRVFWIAGGRAKDGGIDGLSELFPRIARAYLIGEAAEDFARALGDTPNVLSGTMEAAVQAAATDARAEGGAAVVLLSPAAASFDQYPDFEARGEAFRAAVLAQISTWDADPARAS